MRYQETTALRKILALRKRIRAVSGGTGASKTVSILQWLIDYAHCHHNEVIDIVSESYPHLDLGAIAEFRRIMSAQGYFEDKRWNGGAPRSYTFETGTVIQFTSFDTTEKAHGPRRDLLFVNECNNVTWPIVDQLITRTRKTVWLDWNPSEEFWFYEQLLGKRDDIDFMGERGNYPPLTYLDNELLDDGQRNEILSHKGNAMWWRVYGLGLMGEVEGRVYTGWQIIDDVPHEARLERHCLDFGFYPDPAAIIDLYYYNGGYVFDEVLHQNGLHDPDLAQAIKNLKPALTIADCAEPKAISAIAGFGVSIIPTKKGPDSKRWGISVVQGEKISVTKRSVNLIEEYRKYMLAQDREGRFIAGETVGKDDCLDAVRYGMTSLIPVIQRNEFAQNIRQRHTKTEKTNIAV